MYLTVWGKASYRPRSTLILYRTELRAVREQFSVLRLEAALFHNQQDRQCLFSASSFQLKRQKPKTNSKPNKAVEDTKHALCHSQRYQAPSLKSLRVIPVYLSTLPYVLSLGWEEEAPRQRCGLARTISPFGRVSNLAAPCAVPRRQHGTSQASNIRNDAKSQEPRVYSTLPTLPSAGKDL